MIALSCGEVWAGNVSLDGTTPVVKSEFPVVVDQDNDANTVATAPAFDLANGGMAEPFVGIGRAGVLDLDGGTWTRIDDHSGTNNMSGEVFLVKPTVGVSFGYQMDAITRFAEYLAPGLIDGSVSLFAAEEPNTEKCDVSVGGVELTASECRTAVSLALSKSRVVGQYDIEQITSGDTQMVVTLPGKSTYCQGSGVPSPPFQCNAQDSESFDEEGLHQGVTGGEEVAGQVYDRQENFFIPGPSADCGLISPCEEPPVEADPAFCPTIRPPLVSWGLSMWAPERTSRSSQACCPTVLRAGSRSICARTTKVP